MRANLVVIVWVALTSTAVAEVGHVEDLRRYINVQTANVRESPRLDALPICQCHFLDTVVTTGEVHGEWVQIRPLCGDKQVESGWIHGSLVSTTISVAKSSAAMGHESTKSKAKEKSSGSSTRIKIGTPADTVVVLLGKCDRTEVLGRDDNGVIVAWHYPSVTYVMKRWSSGGIECYRVAEIRN